MTMEREPGPAAGQTGRRVSSLGELPRQIAPARDLWPQLEARLSAGMQERSAAHARRSRPRGRLAGTVALAALAVIIIVVLRLSSGPPSAPRTAGVRESPQPTAAIDPRFVRQRDALLRGLSARLAALPPPARRGVLDDLAALEQSVGSVQAALVRHPDSALLQELLVDAYQDEIGLLITVQASEAWVQQAVTGEGAI